MLFVAGFELAVFFNPLCILIFALGGFAADSVKIIPILFNHRPSENLSDGLNYCR